MKPSLQIQRLLRPLYISVTMTLLAATFTANAKVTQAVNGVADLKNLEDGTATQNASYTLSVTGTNSDTTGYYVGTGISGYNTVAGSAEGTLTLGTIGGSVTITNNGGMNAGAIGSAITQTTIENFTADLTVTGDGEARGLGMSNLNYFNQDVDGIPDVGTAASIARLQSKIDVKQVETGDGVNGESYGIHLEYNSNITLVDAGTDIDVDSASGSAAGVFLNLGGHIGTIGATGSTAAPVTINVTSNNNYAMGISVDNTSQSAETGIGQSKIDSIVNTALDVHSNAGRAFGINLKSSGAQIGSIIGTTIDVSTNGILPPSTGGEDATDRTIYDAVAINLDGAGTNIDTISGVTITSSTVSGSTTGIKLTGSGLPLATESGYRGLGATIDSIVNTNIDIESLSGEGYGIHMGAGTTVNGIYGGNITVKTSGLESGNASGIFVEQYAYIGLIAGTTVDISTTTTNRISGMEFAPGAIPFGKLVEYAPPGSGEAAVAGYAARDVNVTVRGTTGQINFVTGNITEATMEQGMGKINGTFHMISDSGEDDNIFTGGVSAGYSLTKINVGTGVSLGFNNSNTDESPFDDGSSFYSQTSFGYEIEWDNTSMHVERTSGIAVGSVIIGSDFIDNLGLQNTILGKDSFIKASASYKGTTAAVYLQGVDLTNGQLLGTLESYSNRGYSGGLVTIASDLPGSVYLRQTTENSIMNHIGGHIFASVGSEDEGTLTTAVVGAQFGNVRNNGAHYKTELRGDFAGEITAVLNDSFTGTATLQTDNIVAAVITYGEVSDELAIAVGASYGAEVLRFDTRANAEDGDAAGVTFSALIYDTDATTQEKTLVGYGDAIMSMVGDINLSTTTAGTPATPEITAVPSVKTTGIVNLNGNLTAGASGTETLTFQDGRYIVTSSKWSASEGIHIGLNDGLNSPDGIHGTATIHLRDYISTTGESAGNSIEIVTGNLNFTGNSAEDVSKIFVGSGMSLEFTDLTAVNIDLKGTADEYETYFENGGGPIFFVDRGAADYFDDDNTGIEYTLTIGGVEVTSTSGYSYKIYHDVYGIYISNQVAPEPSTATLSLLALAGLLARRRRKQQG